MKIFFIGIYDASEPNTNLRNAFRKVSSEYKEIPWNSWNFHWTTNAPFNQHVIEVLNHWKPDIIFMQLQAPNVIMDGCLQAMKNTGAYLVQWTGDARQPLPEHYITFGRKINLSLFNNQNDVDTLVRAGVKADFLQIACDPTIYKPEGSKIAAPEIVFMGNNYKSTFTLSKYRYEMVKFLRQTYGKRFGLYGANWPEEWGIESLMYQHEREAEIYRSCKIGINLSHYDLNKYASDRLFRIMSSGAFCISKEFPEMVEYEGGENFVTYTGDFNDLKKTIDYYLNNEEERISIAKNGCNRTHTAWTWDHRINELLTLIEKHR